MRIRHGPHVHEHTAAHMHADTLTRPTIRTPRRAMAWGASAQTPNTKQQTQKSSTARRRRRRPSAGNRLNVGPQRQLLRHLLEACRLGVELGRLDELQEEVGEPLAQP